MTRVQVDNGRVFMRLGNYEFEVLVPPVLEDSPAAADSTAALLEGCLAEVERGEA